MVGESAEGYKDGLFHGGDAFVAVGVVVAGGGGDRRCSFAVVVDF